MKLFYKSKDDFSYQIKDDGYFQISDKNHENFLLEYVTTYYDDRHPFIVYPHEDAEYFQEIEIVDKINANEDNYFNFDKAILDIGAHLGFYCFETKFKYTYAFEPNKTNFTLLNVNLLMHDKLENSQSFNVLLSDKEEDVTFYGFHTFLNDQENPFLNNEQINGEGAQIVKSHIIDEYKLNNIGFIKIDVEGMEEKVLRGAVGTIVRNNYPPMLFELWDVGVYGMVEEKHESLVNFIESLGYKILWKWGDNSTHLAIHQ